MATRVRHRTLPYDWYVDPAVLRLEQERIFSRSWQYVARIDQLAEPGRFVTASVGTTPIVLVRGSDQELRGFVNVCRHRGYELCDGEGRRETLQCPYHAWTYDLDGSLRSAPRADAEQGFDRADLGLVPVSVDTWGPFVFANPDPDTGPLADWLEDIPELLAANGVDLGALRFHHRVEADEYASNWKVCAENFLECYHCTVAHPTLAKAMDVSADGYLLDTRRWSSTQWGPPRNGGSGVYDATGEIARGQFHFLFPSTTINVMPGRPNLSIGPILPRGPERALRYLDYFFAGDVDEEWLADFDTLDAQVGAEDRVLVERVQRGLRNGVVDSGVLLPRSESLIAHFQALVAEALA
jgi:phenylpropionate dioxygenase-like ring-hydroxylating dioxygenase large terminal subunit